MKFNEMTSQVCLIDADILVYRCCPYGDSAESVPLQEVFNRVDNAIEEIMDNTSAGSCRVFITSDKGDCFRYALATIKPYKGNRSLNGRPYHYEVVRAYLVDKHAAKTVYSIEADDEILYTATIAPHKYILAVDDKDYWTYTGDIYNIRTKLIGEYKYRNEYGGLELTEKRKLIGRGMSWFYAQMLLGDTADNIPGIKGIGDVKTYNLLKDVTSERVAHGIVMGIYKETYGDEWTDAFIEVGQLLWIWQCDCISILARWKDKSLYY